MKNALLTALALAGAALGPVSGAADSLTIGLAVPPTTMDPHFQNFGQNNSQSRHIFDSLLLKDEFSQVMPGLAESWEAIDDTTWEFRLRQDVVFHDGSPFTADDVLFTLERAPNIPDSPNSFAQFTKMIESAEAVDSHTLRITTLGPAPLLPNDIANIWIISRQHGEGAVMEDYNLGHAMIGTGPYQFVSWEPGDNVVYARNPDYWGGAEPWETVTFRLIPSGPARVAALLAGDVDMIQDVPTIDVDMLANDDRFVIAGDASDRSVFIVLDVDTGPTNPEMLATHDGAVFDTNPLSDLRVRQALSLALDRTVLIERVMAGQAVPTGQFVPERFFGHAPDIEPDPFDLARARELMAEAGVPDGFRLTIATSNDRIINAVRLVQAIGQYWSQLGIDVDIEAMPHSVFSPRRNRSEFPVFPNSWGNSIGDASGALVPNFHTRSIDLGLGTANRHHYSNPELDAIIQASIQMIDDEKRLDLYQQAMRIAVEEKSFLPLFLQMNIWGLRQGLTYIPQSDGHTIAMSVRRASE